MPSAPATPPASSGALSGHRKAKSVIVGMVLLNLTAFAPAVILGLIGWHEVVSVGMLTGLAVFSACFMGSGWVTGLRVSVPLAVFCGLTVWAAPYAVPAAIVLAAAAFWRGYGARLGLHNALMTTVIALGFLVTAPPKFDGPLPTPIATGLVSLITALYVSLIMFTARRWLHPPALTRLVTARVLSFSSVLAVVIGIVTWFVIHDNLGQGGAWIILTIIVVFQPYLGTSFVKAGQRAIGTLGGFVVAVIIGEFVSSGPLMYLIGFVLFMLSGVVLISGKPYWSFVLFLTPGIVLVTSAGSTVDKTAVLRLEATGVGLLITVLVMLALTPLAKHFQSKIGAPRF